MFWIIIRPLFGFVAGALVAVLSSIAHDIYKDVQTRKRLKLAIRQEIKSILELIKEERWNKFVDSTDEQQLDIRFNYNYFTIYEQNASLLSLLDPELMENIIMFYNRAKSFLDDVQLYHEFLRKPDYDKKYLKKLRRTLKNQFEILKNNAEEIYQAVEKEWKNLKKDENPDTTNESLNNDIVLENTAYVINSQKI